MASTANYGWIKPTVGGDNDAWGGELNTDLDGIDSVVAAKLSDAPSDTNTYGRKGGAWSIITGASVTASDTAPSSPSAGALWWDSVGGQLYIWYTDPNTSQWVPTANQLGGGYLQKQGVTDGSDAAAGQIGEVISSIVASPGVTLTTSTAANITSISLTAGDWDVQGEVWVGIGTGGASLAAGAINSVSAVLPNVSLSTSRSQIIVPLSASGVWYSPISQCRVNISATTVYYLNTIANFPSGTTTAWGKIWARRAR